MLVNSTIKYTTVLPVDFLQELKQMAERKQIASVNQGIRQAIELYLERERRSWYADRMRDAAADMDFIERMNKAQNDLAPIQYGEIGN